MRKFLSIAIIVCMAASVLFARPGSELIAPPQQSKPQQSKPQPQPQPQGQSPQRKIIDLKADLMGPVAPGDSALFLVGNFAAQHNGAVITCDSAVRYSSDELGFFGNVLINKNSTYIYGDRADYSGLLNEARVYSDIIKVVDGDATLYTYDLVFNTKSNVGTFEGGGVMINRDNLMEANHGSYYANTKELVCVQAVEMRNDNYDMKGDSVIYNTETDHAYYFDNTNIWNLDGDYLYADCGEYQKPDSLYKVTRSGYILTKDQEIWSDSIDYYQGKEHAILRRAVQIDDRKHKTLAFGDYGEYWKYPGNAMLTQRPSIVNYDPEQGDSLFMRADSMFIYTILRADEEKAAQAKAKVTADSLAALQVAMKADTLAETAKEKTDKLGKQTQSEKSKEEDNKAEKPKSDEPGSTSADTTAQPRAEQSADTTAQAQIPADTLTVAERKAKLREAAQKVKAEQKAADAAVRDAKLDSIAEKRQAKITAKLLAQKAHEERALAARKLKAESRLRAKQANALRKGRELPDSTELAVLDSMIANQSMQQDSLASILADTVKSDTTAKPIVADSVDSIAPPDSLYRLIKAYRNVRTYRTDFQSVCDSLVAISRDSTIHLYINPVLWNEKNQITSDVMDIFTKNQQIIRAEFVGQPLMVSEIDTAYYNQVAGKEMVAFFANNKMYREDVNGSARTIYYVQEEDSPVVETMMVLDSGAITFYLNENNKVHTIVYKNDVNWKAFPMDKIPPEQEPHLKNFKWEADRRPTQSDVFDRKIRPSEKNDHWRLSRPAFPIYERLESLKRHYAEYNGWVDRSDVVSPEIDEWMRSLGYTTGQPRQR
ncbi:MAG: OstA-like protein [Alistipes sp.]